jgi:putative solute:sodium symporter small subunit
MTADVDASRGTRGCDMAELTQLQKDAYWSYNIRLTGILLSIWFAVTFLLGGVLAASLNEVIVAGFPLGYWVAAQGSVLVFVAEIAIYARLMNAKDLEYGIREDA